MNPDNLPTIDISTIKPLQGNLKILSDDNYNRLKASIEKYGFFVPIFVWNGCMLDGHGRQKVIIGEGWDIKVPYNNIEAYNLEDAKEKLLHITSQYQSITIDGLQEFKPDWEELPVHFDAIKPVDDIDFDNIKSNEDRSTSNNTRMVTCPECENQFEV